MKASKALKTSEIEFVEVDGKELSELFKNRVKTISIFDVSYNVQRTGRDEKSFEHVLVSLGGVVSGGNVITSDGNIFLNMEDFKDVYETEYEEVKEEDED